MTDAALPPRPGLWAGFRAVFRGLGFMFRTPAAWPAGLVPAAILFGLSALFVSLAVLWVQPALETWIAPSHSWYSELGTAIASWVGALLASVLGVMIAAATTPPLSGPALESIIARQEKALGIPERAALGFFAEMWFGLKAQALAALFAGPLLLLLWIVELLAPPAAVVTIPAKLLVVALGLAWNLFDYPLTLRGVRMRDRLRLVRAYKPAVLGFGLGFALLFWLPCFSILMLPVAVAASTRLVWEMLSADRELLPELPRP
ncbi:MAG: EI24 domain-containing protein [Myxococcales bacterium]|nr:EI24 domain-containing protein [Myxococcales bacterium]MCB9580657.1 EI24 domain-containing protein [Polyangiaceae bacterium]